MLWLNACHLTVVSAVLVVSGDGVRSVSFLLGHRQCLGLVAYLAVLAASTQLTVLYVLRRFGPVVLTLLMTTKQMVAMASAALACSAAGHVGVGGEALATAAAAAAAAGGAAGGTAGGGGVVGGAGVRAAGVEALFGAMRFLRILHHHHEAPAASLLAPHQLYHSVDACSPLTSIFVRPAMPLASATLAAVLLALRAYNAPALAVEIRSMPAHVDL
jgi:sterol desaturase/sphingolipid hydroxylase (fatty acid hydroxylase superfamily)